MTKHHLSPSDAAIILQVLSRIKAASEKSAVIMAALDIDKHDLEKCESVIKRLGK